MHSVISPKGQVTIPKHIRDKLGLHPGSRVKCFIHPNGGIALLPVLPASYLRGMLKSNRRITVDEMSEAAASGAADEYRRRQSRKPSR
jgi:antitoxin PrlF